MSEKFWTSVVLAMLTAALAFAGESEGAGLTLVALLLWLMFA